MFWDESENKNQHNDDLMFNKTTSNEEGSFIDISDEFLKNED